MVPIFSIITANLNSGAKLARTIDSVASQKGEFEYLIMDGLSVDASCNVAVEWESRDPARFRVFREQDSGIYEAMNKGVRRAAGRYLYFIGAGDILMPGVLREIERYLPSHDRGFVYGDVLWNGRRYDGQWDWRRLRWQNICQQSIFYGRRIFDLVGSFDTRYRTSADHALNLRCFGKLSIPRTYLDRVVAVFEEGGASAQGDPSFDRDRVKLIRGGLGYGAYCYTQLEVHGGKLLSLLPKAAQAASHSLRKKAAAILWPRV